MEHLKVGQKTRDLAVLKKARPNATYLDAINKQGGNEYLITVTGVKKMKCFLSLTRCHFQPRVTEGHKWLEMAPSEN